MKKIVRLVCVLLSSFSVAQVHHAPPPPVYAAPTSVCAGDQYYDLSVDGLEKYMDALKASNAEAYGKLVPEFAKLQDDKELANWLMIGTLTAGTALTVVGVASVGSKDSDNRSYAAMISGLALLSATPFIPVWFGPGREDYMDFINQHNRLVPQQPLKMNIGLRLLDEGAMGIVALSF